MSEANNTINGLRDMLFETMRAVKEGKLDLDKAKAVSDIGQVIINSAKVEVDALRVIGGTGSGFIPALPPQKPSRPGITHPAQGITRHTTD